MNNNSLALALSATLLTGTALAGALGPVPAEWAWVGMLSVGPVWQDAGQNRTFALAPEWQRTYMGDLANKSLIEGELFVGVQKEFFPLLHGQWGLAVAVMDNARFSGSIRDDADSKFDNFVYRYKVQHTHVALKGKLLADKFDLVRPWLSASVGVGFNDAHSFENIPTIPEALPTPNFASHTKRAFTYTIGVGAQKAVSAHWQVGAGYEFADWGKFTFNPLPSQTPGYGLALNHLYINGVVFNLTYIA